MLLSIALSALMAAAPAGKTLWLVEPLYPGQEQLQDRTEQAVRNLATPEDRAQQIIGKAELTAYLKARTGTPAAGVLSCLVDGSCKDPLDVLVKNLGFERVQLIKSGQDESGYRVRLSSYKLSDGTVSSTEGSNGALDKALLGAVVKVDQLISQLEVITTPPGATVFVDNEKLGVTPLTTQVLPGDRLIRLTLPGYTTQELTQVVPVRGAVKVERELIVVPARLIATVLPAGTDVVMDGKVLGQDKLDVGIQPGAHVFRVIKQGYEPYEAKADVVPGDTYHLDRTLEPTGYTKFRTYMDTNEEPIYAQHNYFDINFELLNLTGDSLAAKRFGNGTDANATTSQLLSPGPGATLMGVSAEYGYFGKYFGVMGFGLGYSRGVEPWQVSVLNPTPGAEKINVHGDFLHLRALQPQVRYAFWRLVFTLQVGLELMGGQIQETATPQTYSQGFVLLNLLVGGRVSVRAYVVAGLYLQAAWRYEYPIVGFKSADGKLASGFYGWSFGLGYGF